MLDASLQPFGKREREAYRNTRELVVAEGLARPEDFAERPDLDILVTREGFVLLDSQDPVELTRP